MTHPLQVADAFLARVNPSVAAIQLVRFERTHVGTMMAGIAIDLISSNPRVQGPDGKEQGVAILLTGSDGTPVDRCEVCPAEQNVDVAMLERCVRAAWHFRLPLALNNENDRVEAWDPRYPFGVIPQAANHGAARAALRAAGFGLEETPNYFRVTLDRFVPASGFESAVVSIFSGTDHKGTRTQLEITLDRSALAWRCDRGVQHVEGRIAVTDVMALSFESWQTLRVFGRVHPQDIPIPTRPEAAALKHLLAVARGQLS